MKKKSLLWILLAIAVAIGGYFVWKKNSNQADNNKIKIGVILPLTGDAAVYGKAMKNGIELAYNQSSIKSRITLIFEDDKGDKNSAINAGQLLITKGVDAIIGGAQSKTADVLIPIIDKNKLPMVAPGASSVDFDTISHYFFRLWPSDSYDGKIMADFIVNSQGRKKIADFYTNSKYGVGIKNIFENDVSRFNGQIIYSEPFTEGSKDFRTQLLKIKQSDAEAIFIPGYIAEVRIILKQIEELGVKADIYGTSSFYNESFAASLSNSKNAIYFSYPAFSIDNRNSVLNNFLKNYSSAYKQKPDVFAANAYDCFKVIEKAILNGARTSTEIRNKMTNIKDMEGASGKFSFNEFGNVEKEFAIYQINNGKFVQLKKK